MSEVQENQHNKKQSSEFYEWTKAITIAIVIALLIRIFVFEFVIVEQTSMYPTLKEGEKLCVVKVAYWFDSPGRGDIVIVKVNGSSNYVKRVVGLPGETLEIKDNTLYINGKALEEDYLVQGLAYADYGLITIPDGQYFLLGDNRPVSQDSRELGTFSDNEIIAKVAFRVSPYTYLFNQSITD